MGSLERRIVVTRCILHVIDSFFAMFIISPLVVGYWRGLWQLIDTYLYPEDSNLSILISTIIGLVVPLVFTILRDFLQDKCGKNKVLFFMISRVYTFSFGFACVNNWRSLWTFLDVYTGINYTSVISSIVAGMVGLACIGCFRNIVSSPLFVATDHQKNYFTYPTMFQIKLQKSVVRSLFDSVFSVVVCGYLVVAVWRGSFHLLDFIVFPENIAMSAWGSIILGYSCSLLIMLVQKPVSLLLEHMAGFSRLAFLNLYNFVAFVGSVNTWRGLWTFYNIYIFPDSHTFSNITTAATGFVILTFLGASHSVLVRGVFRDGSEPGGEAAFFYYHYFLNNVDEGSDSSLNEGKDIKSKGENCQENDVSSKLLRNHIGNDFVIARETVV